MRGRLPPTIRQLLSPQYPTANLKIEVNGWVKSVRRQKNVAFAVISDGSSREGLQAVLTDRTMASKLVNGASVRLLGQLSRSPGPAQEKELQVTEVEVLGECDPDLYPIQKQNLTPDYLREHCELRARVNDMGAMLRVRDILTKAIHSYFEGQSFHCVHTPIITSNDCEGAGEAFALTPIPSSSPPVDAEPATRHFFSVPAYLTVSSQLHLEAVATSLSRVYTLSPAFRAERSQTNRHLAEFWMLEAEWQFTRSLDDICGLVEDMTKTILGAAKDDNDVHDFMGKTEGRQFIDAIDRSWSKVTYTEAVRELEKHHTSTTGSKFTFQPAWGRPLQSEHERWLADHAFRGPVFVTDYPAILKPFYMRSNEDSSNPNLCTVACFDLLIPGRGELAGGSLREERLPVLDRALEKNGLSGENYGWYRNIRKFGGAPHGGFGMGFERLLSYVTGIENVRECIAAPRWAGRILL
ncbi:asparaginyl-tRNA synthetase [Rickenella mellea]|uniref:asparagine--tRNA ligase n=1 Tax=Rickenella mellea TaxID=50990 RepID=A0A4Y7PTQ4_9AGAM|nr:asparaginyl-tRNA synthetase [Rickenella mellea]